MSLEITQSRSLIGTSIRQRRTMKALGLRRIHHTVMHNDTPIIRGMLGTVSHLVEIKEIASQEQKTNSDE